MPGGLGEPSDIVSNGRRLFESSNGSLAPVAMLDTDKTTLTEVLISPTREVTRDRRRP